MSETLKFALLFSATVVLARWIEDQIQSMIGYVPGVCNLYMKIAEKEYKAKVVFCRECGKQFTDNEWEKCPRCGKKIRWKGIEIEKDENDCE